MLFSIIVPNFNKDLFIEETIQSVINQSYTNWELIIVDDLSTDNSIKKIEDFTRLDSRISLFVRNNKIGGGSACRNLGLKMAQGKYIIFLDSDDIITKDFLKNRLLNITKFSNFNFWVFPIGTFYSKIGDSASEWVPKGKDFLKKFLKHELPWHTMSVVWKAEFIRKLGGFNVEYPRLQDVELHTRALLHRGTKFKIFTKLKTDSYYRISLIRTSENLENQLKNQLQGVFLYINNISSILKLSKQKILLRGTLFSYVTMLNFRCFVEHKKPGLQRDIFALIVKFLKTSDLFSKRDVYYLKYYNNLYKKMWRIKGFNFTMKFFF